MYLYKKIICPYCNDDILKTDTGDCSCDYLNFFADRSEFYINIYGSECKEEKWLCFVFEKSRLTLYIKNSYITKILNIKPFKGDVVLNKKYFNNYITLM